MKIKNINGFSIIELSISLTIIGIIILFTMSSLQAIGDNMAATKTETKIDRLVSGIVNNVTIATSTSTANPSDVMDLRLPSVNDVKTLFVETDGYGNTFDYIPANGLLDISSAKNLCTATNTGLTLQFKDIGEAEYREMPQIAFMIIGKGANLKLDYDNTLPGVVKLDRPNNADDIFRYVTLDELKLKTGCTVGFNERFKILTKEIPPLKSNTIARVFSNKISKLDTGAWCVETPKKANLIRAISFNTSSYHGDFGYPVGLKDSMVRESCSGNANAQDGLGMEVRLSRINNAIPGTYKITVKTSHNSDSRKAQETYAITVPF